MTNWVKLANEIHDNSCRHGWWDEPRSFNEIKALIHSEWSESLEEYRDGHAWYWGRKVDGHTKPEGIGVELIDGVIRILDYIGLMLDTEGDAFDYRGEKCTLNEALDEKEVMDFAADAVMTRTPELICFLHEQTVNWTEPRDLTAVTVMINLVRYVCGRHGFNYFFLLMDKHEYNKTRAYKHGGKLC